jgi:hypothetical protein
MDTSERLLRFAVEEERLAKYAPSAGNRTVWRRMVDGWIRWDESSVRPSLLIHTGSPTGRHRDVSYSWVGLAFHKFPWK